MYCEGPGLGVTCREASKAEDIPSVHYVVGFAKTRGLKANFDIKGANSWPAVVDGEGYVVVAGI